MINSSTDVLINAAVADDMTGGDAYLSHLLSAGSGANYCDFYMINHHNHMLCFRRK